MAAWLMAAVACAAGDNALEAQLRSTILPELSITNQPVEAAVQIILAECSRSQADGWCPGVILNLGGGKSAVPVPDVTLSARDISVFSAFHQLAARCHLNCTLTNNSILLTRKRIHSVAEPAAPEAP